MYIWRVGLQELEFEVYPWSQKGWADVPGIYIFCYWNGFWWVSVYIGKASSFQNRLSNHEKFHEAVALGATHIHAMVVRNALSLPELERQLIETYRPPLNVQHNSETGRAGFLTRNAGLLCPPVSGQGFLNCLRRP